MTWTLVFQILVLMAGGGSIAMFLICLGVSVEDIITWAAMHNEKKLVEAMRSVAKELSEKEEKSC